MYCTGAGKKRWRREGRRKREVKSQMRKSNLNISSILHHQENLFLEKMTDYRRPHTVYVR